MKIWIKKIIFICLITAILNGTYDVFAREKYRYDSVSSCDVNEIRLLENSLFHYSFDNEPVERRLERLELKVFNVLSTDKCQNRITALKSSLNGSSNFSTYTTYPYFTNFAPYPYRVPLRNPHNFNKKINALRNLRSYLKGTMTGYTLPMQSNSYSNLYSTPNYDNFYSNGGNIYEYKGNGHSYRNINTNDGGIKVKIID